MADGDLTESIVRQHLRDQPGEVRCARCLARVLNLELRATESVVVALAERRQRRRLGLRRKVRRVTPGRLQGRGPVAARQPARRRDPSGRRDRGPQAVHADPEGGWRRRLGRYNQRHSPVRTGRERITLVAVVPVEVHEGSGPEMDMRGGVPAFRVAIGSLTAIRSEESSPLGQGYGVCPTHTDPREAA